MTQGMNVYFIIPIEIITRFMPNALRRMVIKKKK